SAELSRRNEAEDQLIARGPDILELLPAPKEGSSAADAARRDAIARIRRTLEQKFAERSTRASTITLHFSNKPLSEVLADLTRQTGNKFKDVRQQMGQQLPDPKLSLDFDKVPFWEALDKTLDQANLTIYHFAESDALGIVARGEKQLPRSGRASYAGPLRLEATRLIAERDLRATAESSSLKLTLEIAWEPRMRPITLVQPLADLKATDDRGRAIQIQSTGGQLERPVDAAGTATEFLVPLVNPPRDARKIASLKGKLRALLPAKIESFEFTGLKTAKKVEQRKSGVTVTLDEVRQNNDAWEVRVRVKFERTAGALESYRGWIFNNEAFLVGPDGKRIGHSGFETTKQSEDEVGLAYLFDLPDGPDKLKFVYKTPAMLNFVPLDFELKDLPLP
ncbi:MAG TPA: hypothetical protein VKB78_08030, partial [Pirellulales bacterium]|nr:hypothetical protein [Pirellulales bacterium]